MLDESPAVPAPEQEQKAMLENKIRTWGVVCHLSALVGVFGIPFGNILGPLVVWLVKRKDHAFIDEQGKEALNFQITMGIYALVAFVLTLILIGFVLLFAIVVFDLVMVIIAA